MRPWRALLTLFNSSALALGLLQPLRGAYMGFVQRAAEIEAAVTAERAHAENGVPSLDDAHACFARLQTSRRRLKEAVRRAEDAEEQEEEEPDAGAVEACEAQKLAARVETWASEFHFAPFPPAVSPQPALPAAIE